jgi:hypothetical protein
LPAPREEIVAWVNFQAKGCAQLGSPFYAGLLERVAADLEDEGAAWEVLSGFENETEWSALALRLMGAVHRLVLQDRLPALAVHYPSVGGDGDSSAAWPLFRDALREHRSEIRRLLVHPCQTNEVGRSAALLGGFLEVAQRTGLPLRILEIGASAGLNLRWDAYRYESEAGGWGDAASPLRFDGVFEVAPPLDRDAEVVVRKGCDLEPIDPTSSDGSLTLRSFIWADQSQRFHRLEAAIEVARQVPVEVERMDAGEFLERELSAPVDGVATVVFHSVFMQYVTDEGRRRILAAIDGAKRVAGPDAPIYYLRMEPDEWKFEVRLDDELLGISGPHGTGVRWNVSSASQ